MSAAESPPSIARAVRQHADEADEAAFRAELRAHMRDEAKHRAHVENELRDLKAAVDYLLKSEGLEHG